MAYFDKSLEELRAYHPPRSEPPDFMTFWQYTLEETRQFPLEAQFAPFDSGLTAVVVEDVTFNGFGGQPIKGWFLRPAGVTKRLPCVVEYIGYGGGRGTPLAYLAWACAGYATLVMDTRGQGSSWQHGDTPDTAAGANPHFPGFMTQGILDPHTYYYRRVMSDAVRAVEAALTHPAVDGDFIAVTGHSQGGGLAIAVSGLLPERVKIAMPSEPFLCHFRRAVGLTDEHPYKEIVRFLRQHRAAESTVMHTLDYFDGVNFAAHAPAAAFYSTALMDMICPPSTVFAAYNHLPHHDKEMVVYQYNEHEGGQLSHTTAQIAFLNRRWGDKR